MGKKMKLLPSLLKNTEIKRTCSSSSSSSSWPWPSCHQPRTLSFRAANNDFIFKTINSAYLDATMELLDTSQSFFTLSPDHSRRADLPQDSSVETVIRRLRSDRLFFEPDETSSILDSKTAAAAAEAEAETAATRTTTTTSSLPFKDSVLMSMDSRDPYADFRRSMEEMVEAHGVKEWEGLEELLCWYLKVNGKSNHGYIVGAFVDLLVSLALSSSSSPSTTTSSSSSSYSPSSPLSFYSSSMSSSCSTRCVSCLEAEEPDTTTTTTTTTSSSSLSLEQVKGEIKHEQDYEALSVPLDGIITGAKFV